MKKIFIIFLCVMAAFLLCASVLFADPYQAPHTNSWTDNLHQMQEGLNRIYQMILEFLRSLGDRLMEIKDKFSEQLAKWYQHLREWVHDIFEWYDGQTSQTQGYLERFKNWFRHFWGQFFPPPQPPAPPSPVVNGVRS